MTEQIINVERVEHIINLFGSFDENIKLLEREYGVNIVCRDTELKICGGAEAVRHAKAAVTSLLQLAARGEQINQQNVNYVISLVRDGQEDKIAQMGKDVICVTTKGRPVKAKTVGQQNMWMRFSRILSRWVSDLPVPARPIWQWPAPLRPSVKRPSTVSS